MSRKSSRPKSQFMVYFHFSGTTSVHLVTARHRGNAVRIAYRTYRRDGGMGNLQSDASSGWFKDVSVEYIKNIAS